MDKRKKELISNIINEYVKTANPVGSKLLAEKYHPDLSSATIRNEMKVLEKEDYLTHPHTSAGRIPTIKCYQFYIDNFLKEQSISTKDRTAINQAISKFKKAEPEMVKVIAKKMADLSQETVFAAFSPSDFFYTGISNLFRQPEFSELKLIYNISEIIDHMDEVSGELFKKVKDQEILLGKRNPFGDFCTAIITRYRQKSQEGILGILGPLRMDYQRNHSLINYANQLLNNKS